MQPPKLNPVKFPGGVCFKLAAPNTAHTGVGYKNFSIRNNLSFGTGEGEGSYTLEERGKLQMAWVGSMKPEWLDGITFSHNWWSHRPDESKAGSTHDVRGGPSVEETDLSLTRAPEGARVLSGCGGIGAGKDLLSVVRAVEDDFWETPRPSNPTMGAHEPTDE